MSTLDPTLESPVVGEATPTERRDPVLTLGGVTTSDHKTIGKLLVGGSLLGLLAVATIGVILGIERVDGDDTLLDVDDLSQLFAAYRVGLVQAVVLPLLLGIGVLVVPLQLGARALAFPRVAAAGLWAWLGGTVLLVIALAFNGGPLGGDSKMVELYLGGNVLALVGLTAVAMTIATSVLTTRAPGMRLHRAPLFSWAALVGSIALVLVLPVAVGSNIVQFVDYRYGGAAFGGSSGIWPWTSYLYTGPVLGITAVFAAGFVADVVAVTFRRRFPHRPIALIGIGLIGTAAFAGIGQQDVIALPGTGSEVRLENFATKLGFLAVWALFTLLPVLGVVIVMGHRRPRPPSRTGSARRQPQRPDPVRLLRPRPRRSSACSARRRPGSRTSASKARCSRRARRSRRSTAPCSPASAPSPIGSPRPPDAGCPSCNSAGWRRSAPSAGRSPRCPTSSPAFSTSRQRRRSGTTTGRANCSTPSSSPVTRPFGLTALGFAGLAVQVVAQWRASPATTRGAARPSSGRRRRRRRSTTSSRRRR